MSERLVKYCASQYNVALGAPTLQLGTLDYYRTLDPSFAISDAGEATHTVRMREGVELSLDSGLSERLFGGAIGATGGDLTVIAGPGAYFKSTVGNAYIFCACRCTDHDPPTLAHAAEFDPTYDSMWEIIDQRGFRDAVGSALLDVITLNDLSPEARHAISSLPAKELMLQVQMMDGPVTYVSSRDHHVYEPADVAGIPSYKEAMERAIFQKEEKDARQREYRFVYIVTHPRLGLLSVKPQPVRVPLNRLHGLIATA